MTRRAPPQALSRQAREVLAVLREHQRVVKTAMRNQRGRKAAPKYFAGYMHDFPGPQGSILSVCCEGPECDICLMDPEAKDRADAFRQGLRGKQPVIGS